MFLIVFFKQKTAYDMRISDWSSDVCSSDLIPGALLLPRPMTHPVKKIVIVGGGTAGWLTAGVIAAKHRSRMPGGFSITLVESPNIPTAGVGEGTWPTLRATLARMGVSETELFRTADAAFKQGAQFARWPTRPRSEEHTPE